MKRIIRRLTVASMLVVLGLGASQVMAQQQGGQQGGGQQGGQQGGQGGQGGQRQGRGNFDPAQMQQRMMERYKEALEVTSEDEWKVIQDRIQKVNEARRDMGFGGRGGFGMMRPGGPGGDNAQQGNRRSMGPEPSAAAQELQQAIESKASPEQLKAKLAKLRDERKQKQASLEKAQEELKKVLSVRREAILVTMGVLN